MSFVQQIGINFVAPALSAVTAAMLIWAGRTLYRTSKVQNNVIYRVEQNEEEIDTIKSRIKELKA
jgi:hypothetical protein